MKTIIRIADWFFFFMENLQQKEMTAEYKISKLLSKIKRKVRCFGEYVKRFLFGR